MKEPALSRALAAACVVLAVLLPLATAIALWLLPMPAWPARFGIAGFGGPTAQLEPWQVDVAWLAGMLPVSCAACGLWHARRCFQSFARGDYFNETAVGSLRGLSIGMLAAAVAGLVAPSLVSVALSWNLGPGHRSLAVGFGSNDLLLLLFAAVVWQIAAVMRRAVAIARENEAFV